MATCSPRRLVRGAVWLALAAAVGCFTGDGLADQPCRSDADCNAWADALGRRISCHDNICGAFCGDGEQIAGIEACDDGNEDDSDACVACQPARCGDGAVWTGHEECDDGNAAADDGCVACINAVCGDGEVWSGKEVCDDGNDDPLDGCAGCEVAVCGDGIVNSMTEACDDGDADDDDGCDSACSQGASRLSRGYAAAHTCAVGRGAIRCWGANFFGQLGYGHNASVGDEATDFPLADVPLDGEVIQVVTGHDHTCALLDGEAGDVRCWGSFGLGHSIGDDPDESPVVVPLGAAATALSTGFHYEDDGMTCAVLTGGAVRCWDNGEEPSPQAPVALAGSAVDVVVAGEHACALLTAGAVQCWGANEFGQLGDPDAEAGLGAVVMLGGPATRLCAGQDHTCAVLAGGAVRCWGYGDYGELGYGDGTEMLGDDEHPSSHAPVEFGGRAVQLACGHDHTCVVRDDDAIVCWGQGSYGQLGSGSTAHVGYNERPVDTPPIVLPGAVLEITAAEQHTCARSHGGAVRCWGASDRGQLGLGLTESIGDEPGEMPPDPVRLYEWP